MQEERVCDAVSRNSKYTIRFKLSYFDEMDLISLRGIKRGKNLSLDSRVAGRKSYH